MPASKYRKGKLAEEPQNTGHSGQDGQADDVAMFTGGAYFVMKQDSGQWHWMLFSRNGRALAMNAVGYNQQNDCLMGIKKVCELADATKVLVQK